MTIISFQHSFIFIKTSKTAGTSIEVELGKIAGPDAIVTPILPMIEGHEPRNFQGPDASPAFYNHMPASLIRERLGAERFERMYKFCVEREPVSKCISHFHMRRNSPLNNDKGTYTKSWQDYCDDGCFPNDLEKYSGRYQGQLRLLLDEVLAYETIAQTLPQLLHGLGVPGVTLTARAKSEYSRNRLITVADVTDAQRRTIYTAFEKPCKLTGMYPHIGATPQSRKP